MGHVAAIDIGTNTIRLLVASREKSGFQVVSRIRRITSMGKALSSTGSIGDIEFNDSIEALRAFRIELDRLGVQHYRACGTAGLRIAGNADRFLAAAGNAGIRVEVISAEEEGRLAWTGMLQGMTDHVRDVILMDIGGGSTEFTVGPKPGQSASLPIGVVVAWSAFKPSDPPEPWQIAAMKHYFAERIASGTASLSARGIRRMVGTAGSFTTLAALDQRLRIYRPERIDGYVMSPESVRRWSDRLCSMTEAKRLALPGMEKGRENYMVPGMLQAVAAIERFGIRELVISDKGLLEGIIDDLTAS